MNLLNKLQAVINSAARLVCYSKTAEFTALLRDLHWLRIRERITFKLCHGIQMPTQGTSYIKSRNRVKAAFRSSSTATSSLVVPVTRRSTLGDRAFPVSAARAWNSLPSTVTAGLDVLGDLAVFFLKT